MRRDIDFSFRVNPLTGDLATKTGSDAIRQSLVNLVRTNMYDRGFNVDLMSNINMSLFETITSTTSQQIRDNVVNTIRNFEPQVEVVAVEVKEDGSNNIGVLIYYTELNNPKQQELFIVLERIR